MGCRRNCVATDMPRIPTINSGAIINALDALAMQGDAGSARAEALGYMCDLFEFGSNQFSEEQIAEFDAAFKQLAADMR